MSVENGYPTVVVDSSIASVLDTQGTEKAVLIGVPKLYEITIYWPYIFEVEKTDFNFV